MVRLARHVVVATVGEEYVYEVVAVDIGQLYPVCPPVRPANGRHGCILPKILRIGRGRSLLWRSFAGGFGLLRATTEH
jgi:hypothetical protein